MFSSSPWLRYHFLAHVLDIILDHVLDHVLDLILDPVLDHVLGLLNCLHLLVQLAWKSRLTLAPSGSAGGRSQQRPRRTLLQLKWMYLGSVAAAGRSLERAATMPWSAPKSKSASTTSIPGRVR